MFVSQEHFVSEVFYFVIKKRVDVTNGGSSSLPRGRCYLQLKKLQFEKIKSKSYVQLEKNKN